MLTFRKAVGIGGSSESIQLKTTAGAPVVDQFTGAEPLACSLWPGEDRRAVASPPASWVDGPAGILRVDFPFALMTDLAPGIHSGRVALADGSLHLVNFALEVYDGPGSAGGRPTYGSLADIKNELPWIEEVFAERADQTGYADVLADARDWVDNAIVRAVPNRRLGPDPRRFAALDAAADGGRLAAELLAADKLILDSPAGRKIKRAAVRHALSQILRRCVGMQTGTDLVQLSAYYAAKANDDLIAATAELDPDDNGRPRIVINLGVTATR